MAKEETKIYVINLFKIPCGINVEIFTKNTDLFIEEATRQKMVFSVEEFVQKVNTTDFTLSMCIIKIIECGEIIHPFVKYVLIDSITIHLLNTEPWFKKEAIKMPKEERYFIPEDKYIKFLEGLC